MGDLAFLELVGFRIRLRENSSAILLRRAMSMKAISVGQTSATLSDVAGEPSPAGSADSAPAELLKADDKYRL